MLANAFFPTLALFQTVVIRASAKDARWNFAFFGSILMLYVRFSTFRVGFYVVGFGTSPVFCFCSRPLCPESHGTLVEASTWFSSALARTRSELPQNGRFTSIELRESFLRIICYGTRLN